MGDFKMSSNRPYLLRAVYEWIVDNQCTPHLLVDARDERVKVPREHVRDGQIVLNINPSAVGQFHWDNDHIEFSARFAGSARNMWIPITAVLAIYARENGEGMAFTTDAEDAENDQALVELDEPDLAVTPEPAPAPSAVMSPVLADVSVPKDSSKEASADAPEQPTPPKSPGASRSHLKVIK